MAELLQKLIIGALVTYCLNPVEKKQENLYLFSALDVARGLALPGPTCPKNESF